MIAVCSCCGKMWETSVEEANEPERLCFRCWEIDREERMAPPDNITDAQSESEGK